MDTDPRAGSIFFVGTATTILSFGGFTLLTDPCFLHRGEKARLGYGLTSRRLTEPALQPEELPDLDAVLLSHFHEDHFDRVAVKKLDLDLPVITTPHAAGKLGAKGFRDAVPLRTWQDVVFRRGPSTLRVTSMPGRHGPRGLSSALPPVMGSLLDFELAGRRVLRLYISGDTLVHERLEEIPVRYPGIDLALLHLGGTRIAGVLLTMDAVQGVQAMRILEPGLAVPIHNDDFDVFQSPLSAFLAEARAAGLADRVRPIARGERFSFRLGDQPMVNGATTVS